MTKKYNREYGKQIVEKYLSNIDLDLIASDLKLLDHSFKVGELAYELANQIIDKNPEFKEIIDPELVGFLGYVHNIGYAIQREKHELHTVYLLTHKENIPLEIAIKTKHGSLVEKYEDTENEEWKGYYPVGLEGIILTYLDVILRKGDNISIDQRAQEIEDYIHHIDCDEEMKSQFLMNFKKAVPRYKKYEKIIKILLE